MSLRSRRCKTTPSAMGVAWYLPEQWAKLREVSIDREELEDTYDDWLKMVLGKLEELEKAGMVFEKVELDVDEWLIWCNEKALPYNSASRANFVSEKMLLKVKNG